MHTVTKTFKDISDQKETIVTRLNLPENMQTLAQCTYSVCMESCRLPACCVLRTECFGKSFIFCSPLFGEERGETCSAKRKHWAWNLHVQRFLNLWFDKDRDSISCHKTISCMFLEQCWLGLASHSHIWLLPAQTVNWVS